MAKIYDAKITFSEVWRPTAIPGEIALAVDAAEGPEVHRDNFSLQVCRGVVVVKQDK